MLVAVVPPPDALVIVCPPPDVLVAVVPPPDVLVAVVPPPLSDDVTSYVPEPETMTPITLLLPW